MSNASVEHHFLLHCTRCLGTFSPSLCVSQHHLNQYIVVALGRSLQFRLQHLLTEAQVHD